MNESCDILETHKHILQMLDEEHQKLPLLQKHINDLEALLEEDTLSDRVRANAVAEMKRLRDHKHKIARRETYYFYILRVSDIIDEYQRELNTPVNVFFVGAAQPVDTTKIDKIRKRYMDLIRFMYPTYYRHVYSASPTRCDVCEQPIDTIETPTSHVCTTCGREEDSLRLAFSYKDADRINITQKYVYERRVHFRECINQLQGKQNCTIGPEVHEKLEREIERHGLSHPGDLPRSIKYERVTKHHISIFLKNIGFTKHYKNLNLIYHEITESPLDDITHLEGALMDDFDKLSKLYDNEYIKTNKLKRKNFINMQYVLFQLLRRHKYPCTIEDFNFLKTIERKFFHDDICYKLFAKLGWNFTPIF